MGSKKSIAEQRNYLVIAAPQAKSIAAVYLDKIMVLGTVMGLPEIDDRYHIWRVPILSKETNSRAGEIVIDAITAQVIIKKTTDVEMMKVRLSEPCELKEKKRPKNKPTYPISNTHNTVAFGDCEALLNETPAASIDLIFTSPPYFNARPEYSDYEAYEEYLLKMRQIIKRCHHVLNDGRFFVINISHILLRRANRNESSRRIAVPFDIHRIFIEEGYEFIDDIIWVKPEGAGWATGRGRRFAADRNPLQYKAVPVTEYVLVYRKKSDLLIDWFIKNHPDRDIVKSSRISDDYEKTNIWKIQPKTISKHPAPFPLGLAERVIKYYSFKNDVVLDPFAGSGTTAAACIANDRRFVLFEIYNEYIELIKKDINSWIGERDIDVRWINTPPATS